MIIFSFEGTLNKLLVWLFSSLTLLVGDRKGIWPVKLSHSLVPRCCYCGYLWGITWISVWKIETGCSNQGSCACLDKSWNFRKLKKSFNCCGKRVEGLEKFGICTSWNIPPINAYERVDVRACGVIYIITVASAGQRCYLHMCWAGFGRFVVALGVWMIDWKNGLELSLNCWMKRPWKALNVIGLLVHELWQ